MRKIGTYGDGEAPLIDGNGAYAAILLDGVSYWKVKGLRICNHSSERCVRQGICISAKSEGITAGIEISDCEIFEVDGENRRAMPVYQSMYWNGAVYVTFQVVHQLKIIFMTLLSVITTFTMSEQVVYV